MNEVVPMQPGHAKELGRIYYDAFRDVTERHGVSIGSPNSPESAARMFDFLTTKDRFAYPATLMVDGKLAGSAWLRLGDEVAAIEDVNVDPTTQSKGVGRALMQHMIDHAHQLGYKSVRLTQSAYNLVSLSLYASMGFEVKDTFVEMKAAPSAAPDETVRTMTEADLPVIERLSKNSYKVSRRREALSALELFGNCLVKESDSEITAYMTFADSGHGVAESVSDVLALVGEAARRFPEHAEFGCPLSLGGLYKSLLEAGCRAVEFHTIMVLGEYEHPTGIWMPSGAY